MVNQGERRKLVAIHAKVADLGAANSWEDINRIIRIVAARSIPSVVLAAFFATHCISEFVDREPLKTVIRKMK